MDKQVFFSIEGPEEVREAMTEIMSEALGIQPLVVKGESPEHTRIDPLTLLAVGSLILAVPASVLAVTQLADRLNTKSKLEKLLQRIETLNLQMTLKDGRVVTVTRDSLQFEKITEVTP